MRILIDTNVIISREDNHKVNLKTAKLFKNAPRAGYEIVFHVKQLEDINKDKDESRKEITLSKLENYNQIDFCQDPNQDQEFITKVGIPKKDNDDIDNNLLYALMRDAVEFLVTEDVEIHKKAEKINLEQRIFTIDEASYFFEDLQTKKIKSPFFLDEIEWAEINIKDPFFDSLKNDYSEFEVWFREKAREGRKGWIYKPNGLEAVCLWKIERKEIVPELMSDEKHDRIKICTMKVEQRGFKIGELFLQLIFDLTRRNNIDEIYLSVFPNKETLIYILQQFGFQKKGKNLRGEDFYLKQMKPIIENQEEIDQYNNIEFSKKFYPSILTKNCDIYTIPIQSKYFKVLFNQFDKTQRRLTSQITRKQIPGNSIKKAYLNKRVTNKLKSGDI